MPGLRSLSACCLLLALPACSEELAEPGSVRLIEGPDEDAWTLDPAPVDVEVEKVSESGERELLLTAPAPLDRFSLGRGAVGSFVVTGKDASGAPRARARSLPIDPAGFAEAGLPLFVSRSERFSRAPGEISWPQREHSPVAVAAGRYLFIAGGNAGDDVQTEIYDLGSWSSASSLAVGCATPPCAFRSVAIVKDTLALGIGDDWAIYFDIASQASGDQGLPKGLPSWADVAGGRTVTAPDGTAYVVGATRPDSPTPWVVEISPGGDQVLARAMFTAAAGAAATWVEGRGLVVTGGGAGVELLAPDAETFVTIPGYANDATTGAGLAALDSGTVVRAGGRDGSGQPAATVEIALGCGGASCAPKVRPELVALDDAVGFSLGDGELLFAGDNAAGETTAVRLGASGLVDAPLRQPRKGGSALAAPTGHVAILGGVHPDGSPALGVELFVR